MKKVFYIILIIGIILLAYRFISKRTGDNLGSNTSPETSKNITLTVLPQFPKIPFGAESYSNEKKQQLVSSFIDHKLATYPKVSSRAYRVGKYAGSGLQPKFDLREDQLKILALNYDKNILVARQKNSGLILKKYNPDFKLYLYIDYGIQPEENLDIIGDDVGNIDDENIDWIIANHPDWLLRDKNGKPLRSASGTLSNAGEYWGDPGNREYQEWFANKINKAMALSGNIWSDVMIDQFFGLVENYTNYAGTNEQTKYKTDKEFQTAQLAFVKRLSEIVKVPVIVNLDGGSALAYPEFFVELGKVGGGVDSEIFPFESSSLTDTSILPPEALKTIIDSIARIPKNKKIMINSKVGEMEGNVDRTLYSYYAYLLMAGRDREVYWTFKEGDSSIPHYWYKEFDLDLGLPLGEADTSGQIWTREFTNATLVVNPQGQAEQFKFNGTRYNLRGDKLDNLVDLSRNSGLLLFKDIGSLNRTIQPIKP